MRTDRVLALLDEKDKAHAQERQEWAEERRSLLDRIQAPEVRQFVVDPDQVDAPQPFDDAAAMAWVGQVVPDGVNAGQNDLDDIEAGSIIGTESA
jgi:hypothetical protein